MEQATAHRGDGAINNIVERDTILSLSAQQFQIANGKAVHPYVFVFFDTAQVLDMSCLQVLGGIQIVQDGACCYHALWQVVHAKTFEVLHMKLFDQTFVGSF